MAGALAIALLAPAQALAAGSDAAPSATPATVAATTPDGEPVRQGTITGQVTTAGSLQPLAGAQVSIPGAGIGAITDSAGRYRLTGVPDGQVTVRFQLIGYERAERTVSVSSGETVTLDVQLTQSTIELEGIVVTGTGGPVQRRTVGTVVEGIDTEDLATESPSTVAGMLEGRVPGLRMTSGGGSVGEATAFEMRGASSIVRSTQPVIYIDGIRVSNRINTSDIGDGNFQTDHLSSIDPDDIARMEVLKGAAATTLYGTQASNGVIQIFTEKGSSGEARLDLSTTQGLGRMPRDRVPIPVSYVGGEILRSDPRDEVLRTGHNQSYNASIRGGVEEARYYVSAQHRNETAAQIQSGLTQYSGRVNLNARFTPELDVGVNAYYTDRQLSLPGSRNQVQGAYANAILSFPAARSEERPYGGLFVAVPNASQIERQVHTRHFIGGANLSYAPTENLESSLALGIDLSNDEQTYFEPFGVLIQGSTSGAKQLHHATTRNLTLDLQTTWSEELGDAFTSRLSVGGQAFFDVADTDFIGVRDFPGPGLSTVGSASTITGYGETEQEEISAGVFVQEQLGWRDRLFATVGLRLDGHSAFGSGYGIQPYPKVNLSYVLSEEDFWNVGFVPQLRLRAAYGTAGLAPGPFDAERTFVSSTYDGQPAIVPGTLGESDLKPERSREVELGFDAGLFDDRWTVDFTYFHHRTDDALVPRAFPPSGGFLQPQLVNAGTITNSGVELGSQLSLVRGSDFGWQVRGSLSTLTSEVDLAGAAPIRPGYQRFRNYFISGYAPSAFFGTALDGENPYDILVGGETNPSDLSGFDSIDQIRVNALQAAAGGDSLAYLGKPQPDVSGNVSMNFSFWSALEVSTSFAWSVGMSTYNLSDFLRSNLGIHGGVAEIQRELADPGTSDGRKQELAREFARLSSRAEGNWVEDADYLRWSRLGIRYTLPDDVAGSLLGARDLAVSLSGRNLLLFTDYRGSDPTTNAIGASSLVRNTDFIQAPLARELMMTVEVGF